jgi:CRP/FNR family transcriptional regulator, anaerobic regulatory protein
MPLAKRSSAERAGENMTSEANWTQHFPALGRLPPAVLTPLVGRSSVVALPAGSRIFGPGQAPESFLLLIDGTVRVQQVSESGREIVLYRIQAGDSCALTTACLMGYEDYQAEAIAETDVHAVAIPRAVFDDCIATSVDFRRFVFTAFSTRVTDLFRIIDEVAFARIDIRLALKLLDLSHGADSLSVTQQQLAAELGTAREVVSRMLAEFQRRGWIVTTRGSIALKDRPALERLSREH